MFWWSWYESFLCLGILDVHNFQKISQCIAILSPLRHQHALKGDIMLKFCGETWEASHFMLDFQLITGCERACGLQVTLQTNKNKCTVSVLHQTDTPEQINKMNTEIIQLQCQHVTMSLHILFTDIFLLLSTNWWCTVLQYSSEK